MRNILMALTNDVDCTVALNAVLALGELEPNFVVERCGCLARTSNDAPQHSQLRIRLLNDMRALNAFSRAYVLELCRGYRPADQDEFVDLLVCLCVYMCV